MTIEQAAKIASVNLSELLQKLNKKIDANMPIEAAPSAAPPSQRNAERPEILGQLQPVDQVHFYRRMPAAEKMPPPPASAEVPAREKTIELDVRELSPPEPMMRILETIPQVDEKTLLFVHHHREPLFLYEKLQARGYKWHVKKIAENYFHVKIWKDGEIMMNPITEPQALDVRQFPPAKRHSLIFQTFEALKPCDAFVLVNDHDPKPLFYQFKFEQEGRFTWEYLEQGPEVWRVQIGKV